MSEQYPISEDFIAGLADEQFIQQLANQFFKAPPVPQGSTVSANPATIAQGNPATTSTAPSAAATSIPASVAGSGISPSAGNQGNGVDLKDPQTSLPDPHFAGRGHVPLPSPEAAALLLIQARIPTQRNRRPRITRSNPTQALIPLEGALATSPPRPASRRSPAYRDLARRSRETHRPARYPVSSPSVPFRFQPTRVIIF